MSATERHALVTGGSRGIGKAIVLQFLSEGMRVSTCGRNPEALAELVTAAGEHADRLHTAEVDVTDLDALRKWVTQRGEATQGLHVVVSNVSAMGGTAADAWRASTETDLLGFVTLAEAAVPHLERTSNGSLIAIGTTAAVEAFGRNPAGAYGAVKAAVIHHSANLARTLAPKGIRSNVVSPGPVFFEGGAWDQTRIAHPDVYERVLASIPRGKMATPEDVAHTVAFLASDAAANITGINLITDGGMTQRVNF